MLDPGIVIWTLSVLLAFAVVVLIVAFIARRFACEEIANLMAENARISARAEDALLNLRLAMKRHREEMQGGRSIREQAEQQYVAEIEIRNGAIQDLKASLNAERFKMIVFTSYIDELKEKIDEM